MRHLVRQSLVGGLGIPGNPAFIQLDGVIKDTCNNGYATLHLHYDTIDNPKDPQVGHAGPNSQDNTPFRTEDDINTYRDIYVLLCSSDHLGFRCGNKKGPGA
jgi:hypothetical protein